MIILGIETSGNVGGVALSDGDNIIGETSFRKGMIHGKALVPSIRRLLQKLSVAPGSLEVVAVSLGPGSYTGVRVGVACAKTLCHTTGAKLVGVATLDALVEGVPKKFDTACPIIDARRGDVYACIYRRGADGWCRVEELAVGPPEIVAGKLPHRSFVFGNGLAKYAAIFEERDFALGGERYWWGKARYVCGIGARAFAEGRFEDPLTFEPTYLSGPARKF